MSEPRNVKVQLTHGQIFYVNNVRHISGEVCHVTEQEYQDNKHRFIRLEGNQKPSQTINKVVDDNSPITETKIDDSEIPEQPVDPADETEESDETEKEPEGE